MADAGKVALSGSMRVAKPGSTLVGPTDSGQLVEVSIVLKQRHELKLDALQGRILSHDEFASAYGAEPQQVERVKAFARDNGLEVIDEPDEVARRTVKVRGTVANLEKAFSVELNDYSHPAGAFRGRVGEIQVTPDVADVIQGVFGLDNRPQAVPHFRYRSVTGAAAAAASTSYSPVQVAQLYSFPNSTTGAAGVTGAGQTIGIIELGGGYNPDDITSYFDSLDLAPPTVTDVFVDGGTNSPTNANSADAEVCLDIEVAGAVAPGAKIVVYFCPNTSQGFQDALSTAVHDSTNNPSVVSISWGGPESTWTSALTTSFDQVAQEAAALGVTITVAAGDSGSTDGLTDGENHVDFPASSPHVLGCGGTTLLSSSSTGTAIISSETVWNDGSSGGATGGGFSDVFTIPGYQAAVDGQTGRGVPDVAGDADPDTGYNILVDGEQGVVGGTSAVAPLWAGLVALLNQQLNTRLGYLNPVLYALTAPDNGLNDITSGNNGAYSAGPGWDPATGLGSPIGTALAQLLLSPPATTVPSADRSLASHADQIDVQPEAETESVTAFAKED